MWVKIEKAFSPSSQFSPVLREPKIGSCKMKKKIYWRINSSYKNEISPLHCYYFVFCSRLLFSEIILIYEAGGNSSDLLSSSKCYLPRLSHIAFPEGAFAPNTTMVFHLDRLLCLLWLLETPLNALELDALLWQPELRLWRCKKFCLYPGSLVHKKSKVSLIKRENDTAAIHLWLRYYKCIWRCIT